MKKLGLLASKCATGSCGWRVHASLMHIILYIAIQECLTTTKQPQHGL